MHHTPMELARDSEQCCKTASRSMADLPRKFNVRCAHNDVRTLYLVTKSHARLPKDCNEIP